MGIRVRVDTIGGDFKLKQRQFINNLSSRHLEAIAKETETVIKEKITESIQRPGSTGNLANAFFAEKIANGWGVGRISFLDENVPYWFWINFGRARSGRTTPPVTKGHFSPGPQAPNSTAFRQGRFQHNSDPNFLLTPGKAIEAHNYIEQTLSEIPRIVNGVFRRFR